jgi:hypothetical protein
MAVSCGLSGYVPDKDEWARAAEKDYFIGHK